MKLLESIQEKIKDVPELQRIKALFEECLHQIEENPEAVTQFIEDHPIESISLSRQSRIDYYILIMLNHFYHERDEGVEKHFQLVLNELENKGDDFLIAMLYLHLGAEYQMAREYQLAMRYHLVAAEMLDCLGKEEYLGHVLTDIGVEHLHLGHYTQAMEITRRGVEIGERLGSTSLIFAYNNLASIFYNLNKYDRAIEYYRLALQTGEQMDYRSLEAHIYNNIANIYSDKRNFDKALEYYQKSLSAEPTKEESFSQASTTNNIGLLYMRQMQIDKAKEWFKRSIVMSEKAGFRSVAAKNYLDISDVYVEEKDYVTALAYLDRAEEYFTDSAQQHYLRNVYHSRAAIFLILKDCDKAEAALNMAMENQGENENPEIYKTFSELYTAKGDVNKVVEYQKKQIEALREQSRNDYNQKIAEMQAAFEVEQKEKEAEIYRDKAIELEKKNQEISAQKVKLEKTLNQLRKSEISYDFLNHEIKERLGLTIIGESSQMKRILELVQRVAQAPSTSVLITGETGTGKELVARAIHNCSERKGENFCAVNVSSIPETLFESEFFGYKKNAFTGAKDDKAGWFEIANEGTLFLDEVGTWQPQLQSKFLRVLESKKIIPVGSEREIPVDFRLISATNDSLQEMIDENRFRADLYYRLSSFVINIPPLRERVEDIPALLEYFVKHFGNHLKKKIVKIEKQVETALMSYSFPGNVRELKNMIERAVILSNSSTLKLSCFTIPEVTVRDDSVTPLDILERDMVLRALKQTGFHQRNAAKLLGITPKSLERRMIKYEIKRDR